MPLRDHFHFPANRRAKWDRVHGGWPMVLTATLNQILPPKYQVGPFINIGSLIEIDTAAYELDVGDDTLVATGGAVVAAAATIWAPPAPSLAVPAVWSGVDTYEVRIYDVSEEQELVAAVELVSPSNKDRPATRRTFVSKCASLLQAGVSVVVIDVVTDRDANLYAELLESIGQSDPSLPSPPPGIYAVSLRTRAAKSGQAVEAWYHPLAVGQNLPTLPLWLAERLSVPLELEAIYERTLQELRIV